MAQAERAEAPFTDAQVEAINRYQQSGEMHPFTCRFRTQTAHLDYGEHDFGILVATTDRLRCRDCDYTQEWVWDFMARGSTGHDEYGLDPDKDWEGVAPCADPDHKWGPWVLSPVFANREDRFCTACGVMEMQYLSDGG